MLQPVLHQIDRDTKKTCSIVLAVALLVVVSSDEFEGGGKGMARLFDANGLSGLAGPRS